MSGSLRDLDGDQIEALYAQASNLVLELPKHCEFGVDGQLWTVEALSGVKFIPPGLHLFVVGSPASSTSLTSTRHGFLHFIPPQSTLLRQWDLDQEALLPSANLPTTRSVVEGHGDVISLDHLKSLDAHLAPYPYEHLSVWTSLSSFIDARCLARVLGFKSNGDALADGLQLLTSEAPKPTKQQWGKPRGPDPEDKACEPKEPSIDTLGFATFDLKRSWPPQSVGEDLTLHSRDKRWLREQVIDQVGGPKQLLGELQLAFILFTQITNFSVLDVYRNILSLLCRSSVSVNDGDLYQDLLTVVTSQIDFLRPEFFVEDLPELEAFYTDTFEALRHHLKSFGTSTLVSQWERLSSLTKTKFGWNLKQISGYAQVQPGTTHYNLASESSASSRTMDDEDLLAEEGEDAPVVVEL